MRILVNARQLSGPLTGVGEYATQVLRRMVPFAPEDTFTLLTTGTTDPLMLPLSKGEVARHDHRHVRVPNKLVNGSVIFTGRPTIGQLAGGAYDRLFLPNLDIVSVPATLPYALTIHDLSWKLFPEWYSWKMRAWHAACRPERLIRGARTLLVPSKATAEDLVACFPGVEGRVRVIPHGLDPAFSPEARPDDREWRGRLGLPSRYLLFVGTLEPRKNVPALVDAVAAYRQQSGDDLALVLAGGWGWNTGELKRRLAQPEAKGWVQTLGYVPSEARPALYRGALALVWPSLYEGFGLPVLEAMGCGTPVIGSLTSAVAETAGNAAILVDPLIASDIAEAIGQLLGSSALRARLVGAGLARAQAFSWDEAAQKTLLAIRE